MQDGYPKGVLEDISIDSMGILVGEYSNGKSLDLAQLAVATFSNPSGLDNEGGTMFLETPNSGRADIGAPGSGRRGTIVSGMLEMSNVDLTREFTNMIIAERGFQANARTITTVDRIIMELMRLR
jgi:flagellar hook protein FlgE